MSYDNSICPFFSKPQAKRQVLLSIRLLLEVIAQATPHEGKDRFSSSPELRR